jgi:hypothetical protein
MASAFGAATDGNAGACPDTVLGAESSALVVCVGAGLVARIAVGFDR